MKPYPAYKDSGVEWLGKIPAGWEVKKLKRFSKIFNGSTPKTGVSEYWDNGNIVWITPDDLGKLREKRIYDSSRKITEKGLNSCGTSITPPNSIVLSTRAPIGHMGITNIPSCTNQGCRTIVPDLESCDVNYTYYLLYGQKEELQSLGQGSTFTELSAQKLRDFTIPFPSLCEQRAIAAFLDHKIHLIDTYLTKKQQQIERLQAYRTALINQAVTKGLNPNAPMKASGIEWLGEIPAHWELKRLKHISPKISVGLVIKPSTYVDENGTVPFFFGSNISEYHISTNNVRRITKESNQLLENSMLHEGDLVTVRVGYPGVTAVIPKDLDGANCASMMIVRRGDNFDSGYLCACLNSRIGRYQIGLVEYGAAQKQFNIGHAIDFVFPIPPYSEQKTIALYAQQKRAEINKLIEKLKHQIDRLQAYRTALISDAVTGKIDVRTTGMTHKKEISRKC